MKFYQKVSNILGTTEVEIEGFFTERVINLCNSQNIKIWNIKNVTSGIVRFTVALKDVRKIKPIVKKTKCRLKIIKKSGVYFKAFKYRKRKLIIPLILLVVIAINVFNKMILHVEVSGNETIPYDYILEKAKVSGLYKGKFKFNIDNNYVIKLLKNEIPELAWVGVEYMGTTAYIRVVEKTKVPEEIIYDKDNYGDIIANKSGVITKIVAENGTAVHKVGSYIENGMMLIEGTMHSEILGDYRVRASGTVRMDVDYVFEKEYAYDVITKEYPGKRKYTIGFSFNDKEIFINYLNKSKKYDTLKNSKCFTLFGNKISFDYYTFDEYIEKQNTYTYDDLLSNAILEKENYKSSIIGTDSYFVKEEENVEHAENGIKYKCTIVVNEKVGMFKGE